MKIGIFGGTFNPTHKGHLESLIEAKEQLGLDTIYIFPSYITPDKEVTVEDVSAKDRMCILKASVKDFNKKWIKISDYEIKSGGTSYTYKTIKYMREKFPEAELFLIMGDDRYPTFNTWKNYEYIRENVNVIILKRHDVDKIKTIAPKDTYLFENVIPISSSETLTTHSWNNLFPSAIKYIAKHYLYLRQMTYQILKDKRYDHVMSVANNAQKLMKENTLSRKSSRDAYIAGMVHDNSKYMDEKEIREYLGEDFNSIPYKALHGYAIAKWLQDSYKMNNKKILSAVSKHTLASPYMSKIDKAVYVADKTADDRKGSRYDAWRDIADKNLDVAFEIILRETSEYLVSQNIELNPITLEALQKYVYPTNIKQIKGNNDD